MPRSDPVQIYRAARCQPWLIGLVLAASSPVRTRRCCPCQPWLIGLVLAAGCADSQTDLQDTLARRVMPVGVGERKSTSQTEGRFRRPAQDGCDGAAGRRLATSARGGDPLGERSIPSAPTSHRRASTRGRS